MEGFICTLERRVGSPTQVLFLLFSLLVQSSALSHSSPVAHDDIREELGQRQIRLRIVSPCRERCAGEIDMTASGLLLG